MTLSFARFKRALVVASFFAFGCASGIGSERSTSVLELSPKQAKPQLALLWITLTDIHGTDGLQGAPIDEVSSEIVDLVNHAMIEQLRRGAGQSHAIAIEVPPEGDFGSPITLPPSTMFRSNSLRSSLWSTVPPRKQWSAALRNEVEFNVFSDTVELQLASVLTVFDPVGKPYWQAAARSEKYYEAWATGEQLAALSAKFVVESARENSRRILKHTR